MQPRRDRSPQRRLQPRRQCRYRREFPGTHCRRCRDCQRCLEISAAGNAGSRLSPRPHSTPLPPLPAVPVAGTPRPHSTPLPAIPALQQHRFELPQPVPGIPKKARCETRKEKDAAGGPDAPGSLPGQTSLASPRDSVRSGSGSRLPENRTRLPSRPDLPGSGRTAKRPSSGDVPGRNPAGQGSAGPHGSA